MTALVVTLAVVVALLVVLVAGLLRSHAEILRTLHDAGLGHDPDAGADADGAPGAAPAARPATPTSGPSPEASDLAGVTPDGDAVAVGVARRDRADAARLPVERLPHVPGVLGDVRRSRASTSPAAPASWS